jgi:TRAP-type uncharacterized transport system substrate-binding protein
LIADAEFPRASDGKAGRIRSLVLLHRSVLCIFARKGGPFLRVDDLRGRQARVYTGQRGSGARHVAQKLLAHFQLDYRDVCSEWSPEEVARAMTGGGESRGGAG